ncbi:MAG TPA: Gfo/Idh/MocA family oxidoreductase [Xanthobacteraceae bacterium]|nr:Gfo/Idh/MocA family oxidoreductase [Xanthobacteraceae bacterium]
MIRAAIVGLGRWGRALVNAVAGNSDDIRFVCAATRTRESAEGFCRERGIALVAGYEDILQAPDIDAVVLATPHSLHEPQALAAIAANKHVFVEKPLTLDLESARRVAEAARQAGLVLAVGFTRRFHPAIAELRARLRDGRLGTMVAMVAQHTTSTAQFVAADNWRASAEEAPAGAFTAVGVHSLDHMVEFGGRVRDVRCITARNYPGPSDDTTTVMLRFESGATGLLFCSVATPTNFEFTAYGTQGLAEISRYDLSQFRFVPGSTLAPTGSVTAPANEILQFSGFDMLHAEMTAFARAIREREPYPVPVAEVLHGMAVFDAVVESAKRGEIVAVRN